MKMLIILFSLLSWLNVTAHSPQDSIREALDDARLAANIKSSHYDPQKAYSIYSKLALQGNSEAMNGLGMLYSQGLGVTMDDNLAFKWIEKAAKGGYDKAIYNLALMYKSGVGTTMDMEKAYKLYKKGADLNIPLCLYGQGYMLYKGYGCTQNYQLAAQKFKKGASFRDEGSFYMLGLCYRNGYGLAQNLDSARFWLNKAAKRGDHRAIEELANPEPENVDLKNVPDIQAKGTVQTQPVNLKTGFQQIQHHVILNDLTGDFQGYVLKFDWSGRHIISQANLQLHLERRERKLSGRWEEEGQDPVRIAATLEDTAVVFNNPAMNLTDHYHKNDKLTNLFKDSHFSMAQSNDTMFLSGSVRLQNIKFKEPAKPEFIMLIQTGKKEQGPSDSITNVLTLDKADSLHFIAYPNPFSSSLKLRYTLKKTAMVTIIITDVLNGKMAYRTNSQTLAPGDHTTPIAFNGPPGNYVITLQYGNKIKSAIVLKN